MYIPRGKLLALITIVVAASLVTATGAFSSVEAERTAEVKVAGDADAYLGLEGTSPYAEENGNGELEIKFDSNHATEEGGQGVNPNSVTRFDNVFTITNQGTQKVEVTVTGGTEKRISIHDGEEGGEIKQKPIKPGQSIVVGLEVDATGKTKTDSISEEITISAMSTNATGEATLPDSSSGNSGDSNESEG